MDPVPDHTEMFPNPTGNFDTASYLWLWANQQNWNWLAFQTTDCHTYTSTYYRGNIKIKDRIEKRKLFYHAVSGSIIPWETSEPFTIAYEESKDDDDDDD